MSNEIKNISTLQAPATKAPQIKPGSSRAELEKAAKEFESVYLDMVMKSMRATTFGENEVAGDSEETKFFRTMLDTEFANESAKKSKFGIANALMKQFEKTILREENANVGMKK